jgi:hypothetical protein
MPIPSVGQVVEMIQKGYRRRVVHASNIIMLAMPLRGAYGDGKAIS